MNGTLLFADPTSDTFGAVDFACDMYLHWAGVFTSQTSGAFFFVQMHLNQTESVKNAIKSAHRTQISAENSRNKNGAYDENQ